MGHFSRLSWLAGLIAICLVPLLLCSCATQSHLPVPRPADTRFNSGAGRGDGLLLTLHLQDGEKLLFIVDTGLATTILDKSLESKLGKRRQTGLIWYGYFGPRSAGVYETPPLYLGNTRLQLGRVINTDDLEFVSLPGRKVDGILGMDCLKHYCIQLDFTANKMRFLDPDRLETNNLGNAFHLTTFFGEVSAHADFLGVKNASLKLDTGDYTDGVLKSGQFQHKLQAQPPSNPTNLPPAMASQFMQTVIFPQGEFGGETYSNLAIHPCPWTMWLGQQNLLGLRFLARHLVTLNFPKHTLYLQRESVTPLPDDLLGLMIALGFFNDHPAKDALARFKAYVHQQPGGALWLDAGNSLEHLNQQQQLPGWEKKDLGYMSLDLSALFEIQAEIKSESYPAIRTLVLHKNGSPLGYHYALVRASRSSPWKLQRAWTTNTDGKLQQEYPAP